VFERGPAVEAETGHASNREFDRQHISSLAGWIVAGRTMGGKMASVPQFRRRFD
jgi:hypothetical protein